MQDKSSAKKTSHEGRQTARTSSLLRLILHFPTRRRLVVTIVSVHNTANQRMPNHVGVSEVMKGYSAHAAQNHERMNQTGSCSPSFSPSRSKLLCTGGRSICVMSPVMDGARPEAQTSEEHLHLLSGRILGFIENEKGIVERASAQ